MKEKRLAEIHKRERELFKLSYFHKGFGRAC